MNEVKQREAASPRLLTDGKPGEPTNDETARHAYRLREKQGRQPDHEFEHWFQAEAELRRSREPHGTWA